MKLRLALVVVPAILLAGFIFFIFTAVPALIASQPYNPSAQPIHFDHEVHVKTVGIECTFCHRTATQGITAGYPDLQQCMFCHAVVNETLASNQHNADEILKVRQKWAAQEAINWVRIHRLPDHVGFVHEPHLRAGFQCATCHGDVGSMGQVKQVRALNMGDCLDCHKGNNPLKLTGPTECATCHK
ncbi:MAG: hypothetical protein HW416_2798 [Chloroflexi bacterium]|nr:hypothetical protein [Chloroflexota bacterium]